MPTINGKGQATIFSRNELAKFFKVAKTDDFKWFCLFKFLYYSGERSGCVLQTKWSDVDFDKDLIIFRAETRKGKIGRKPIPIHPELCQVFLQYKKRHSEIVSHLFSLSNKAGDLLDIDLSDFMFLSSRKLQAISRSALDRKMKEICLKCGFENKGFSLHSFRRTFVTRLYEVNKNVKECMAMTGHTSVQNFMLYVDISDNSIIETINSL